MSAACCDRRRSSRRARSARRARSTAGQLRQVEDREIDKIIKKQEEVGLKLATDGEFRRSWWQFDFYKGLDGVEIYTVGEGIQVRRRRHQGRERARNRQGRILQAIRMLEHFKYLKGAHQGDAEDDHSGAEHLALPARGGPSIDKKTYPELDAYFDDVAAGLPQGDPSVLRRRLPLSANG